MKQAIKIKENVYWVGVRDLNVRDFHGELYPVEEGATYNAYLVIDDQITLFDTVEEEFCGECIERIESVLDGRSIDNIIVQHAEPDHSGGFKKIYEKYPNAKVYTTKAGVRHMQAQYIEDTPFNELKTGDTLSTGKYSFTFVEMNMIHWPDNMLTYCPELKVVFSNDAFGQHIVNYQMTDENLDKHYCIEQAKEYFANIVMPYTVPVKNKLNQILAMNLDIEMILPAHGIIWKNYVTDIIEAYKDFATLKQSNKVVIVYESVWKHTQQIAESLAEGFAAAGMDVKVYKLSITRSSIVMKELMDSKMVCVGTGTYNNAMAPSVASFLERVKSCKINDKKGLAFGAYGWFRNVPSTLSDKLKEAGFEPAADAIAQNFTPSEDELDNYYKLALEIGKSL